MSDEPVAGSNAGRQDKPGPLERKKRPERAAKAMVGVVLGIVLLLFALHVADFMRFMEYEKRGECQRHLKALGLAARRYAQEHGGRLPELSSEEKIRESLDGYGTKEDFACPTGHRPYRGHAALAKREVAKIARPEAMILFYEANTIHFEGRNVVYVDGHVKWLNRSRWEEAQRASELR